MLGTIDYLSPEGCNGAKLDARSDIWAFGVLLYELLTGQRPFRGENLITTMTAILSQPTPDLLRQRPEVPQALARLIYQMLEKDPQKRLPSVRLAGAELEAIKQGQTIREQSQKVEQPSPDQHLPASLLAVISGPRHNLPTFSTPLVGREAELAELAHLLAMPEVHLITILGPGGMGKTRLSVAAATGQIETLAQGVTFVSLAPVNPADFTGEINPLVATLAEALKFALQAGNDPAAQLLAYLQTRETLLVLDNFEHFLASDHFPAIADFLSSLLSQAPHVKILVTSRERLNLEEEWLFQLQGLAFPRKPAEVSETSAVWAGYAALQLFEQRARKVKPGFDLAAEQPWAEQICRLVEGMPLGIELAAAWVRLMPCQMIVQELQKGIDVLTTQLRNIPERQRSLRTVFEHSWRLLSAAEREVMRKLSIFRGGFQREAAEVVAGASLGVLSALADKSLVRVTPSGRYELHELLRQYAAEKLRQRAEEATETQTRHGRYYLAFLADQERHLKGPKLKEARAALTADIDNIRLAWHWTVERGHYAEVGLAMESLWNFYDLHGWFLEAEEVFARIVTEVRPLCNLQLIAEEMPLTDAYLILGRALGYQSYFQMRLGLLPAKMLCQESLALLRTGGDSTRRETALSLNFLSDAIGWLEGQHREAVNPLKESLEHFKGVGDLWGIGYALMNLGQHLNNLGEHTEAERIIQESIGCLNKIGEQLVIIYAISTLGYIATAQDQFRQAETFHLQCLQRRTELGDRPGLAYTLRNLGWVATRQGKHAQAQQYFKQSITLGREIGLPLATGFSLFGLGWAALGLEKYDEAEEYFYNTLKTATTSQSVLDALIGLTHLLARKGKSEWALELMALVLEYPTIEQPMKNLVTPLQAELAAMLPPEVVVAAQARGRARTLEATAAELLAELEGRKELGS